jgi:hypothetical protein
MAQLLTGTRIYGNTSIDSQMIVGNVTPYTATSNSTGSLIVTGGVGVSGNIYVGGTSSGSDGVYTDILRYAANGLPWVTGSASGGGGGPAFSIITIAGQPDAIANIANAPLTLVAGNNISLSTNGVSNTITISGQAIDVYQNTEITAINLTGNLIIGSTTSSNNSLMLYNGITNSLDFYFR